MPTTTRFFIKSGLIYFVLALAVALLSELQWIPTSVSRPTYWHMLMVGWITQIIMGVSLWMFPGRSRGESIRDHLTSWVTFVLLNAGLLLRFLSEPMVVTGTSDLWNKMLVLSAVLQWLAACAYVVELWPRVQSKQQRLKNSRRSA
jgi:hypothetical protein